MSQSGDQFSGACRTQYHDLETFNVEMYGSLTIGTYINRSDLCYGFNIIEQLYCEIYVWMYDNKYLIKKIDV